MKKKLNLMKDINLRFEFNNYYIFIYSSVFNIQVLMISLQQLIQKIIKNICQNNAKLYKSNIKKNESKEIKFKLINRKLKRK